MRRCVPFWNSEENERGGGGQCVQGGSSASFLTRRWEAGDGKQFPEKEDDFVDKTISVHF